MMQVLMRLSLKLDEYNLPEPDILVLQEELDQYLETEIIPDKDVLLIVEISDTTLVADLQIKPYLYAKAGIPEYWVVNLPERTLIVHRDPTSEGYNSIISLTPNQEITPLFGKNSLSIAEIFIPA